MGVLGRHEDEDYLPEDGILVVQDVRAGSWYEDLTATDAHPVGTLGRSGRGWLYAAGGDGPCVVRLQLRDDRPADDDQWSDVVEVPYLSPSGTVSLTGLTTGPGDEHLRLGEPGMYRLRAAHRPLPPAPEPPQDEDDLKPTDLWQLDFWPDKEPAEPPRWFRRDRPPVRKADPGWTSVLGFQDIEVANVVEWAGRTGGIDGTGGMTLDDIDTWGADHHRGPNWLDQPLRVNQPRDGWPTLAEIARQVRVPEPRIRRDLLPLYVGLQMVTFDGTRYAAVEDKPLAQDVLQLPDPVSAWLELSQAVNQYTAYAADLVSVVFWGGTEQTIASLAERTLASEDDVRNTLRYAEEHKLLEVQQRGPDEVSLTMCPAARPR
ncbi:hypothetical protein [Kribbella soli]|uniref:Uncharacterized protein n=1 Tax=Kribbella soli TaxID=1124743 RepID=A0A4R0HEP0_9ACTN|nr:hypothetical protein [Kribbella soli]TCC07282.1 hypothetical protein E0H45_14825 [Kribbella soli]